MPRLDDVRFGENPARGDAPWREGRTVDAAVFAEKEQFGERFAGGRRLLHAMAGKTGDRMAISGAVERADQGVTVEGVVVVVAGPCGLQPDRLEGGDAGSQARPDFVLEQMPVGFEIGGIGRAVAVGRRRHAGDEAVPFRPHPETRRIDRQRHGREPRPGAKEEDGALARLDGEVETGKARDMARRCTGGDHETVEGPACAIGEIERAGMRVDRRYLAGDQRHAIIGAQCLPVCREQRHGVEPALARPAERAGGDTRRGEPGKARGERLGTEKRDIGAASALDFVIVPQHITARIAGEQQVAVLVQRDVGACAEKGRRIAEDFERAARQGDVFGKRELLADAGCGKRSRGPREGGVALEDGNRFGAAETPQVPGCRRARKRAADDRYTGAVRCHRDLRGHRRRLSGRGQAAALAGAGALVSNRRMTSRPVRLRRSVLYVPAANARAVAKAESLACDTVIFDLEDAVAPEAKAEARESLRDHFRAHPESARERVIRINAMATPFGTEDFLAARFCKPDAILIPKVELPEHVGEVAEALAQTDAPDTLRLWAMMETPKAVLNAAAIAQSGETAGSRFDCMVAGTNDLAKDLRMPAVDRAALRPHLTHLVLAARAFGLDIIDGVFNAFRDEAGFAAECAEGAAMGFDGKSLIHPAQIDGANAAFGVSADRAEATLVSVMPFRLFLMACKN